MSKSSKKGPAHSHKYPQLIAREKEVRQTTKPYRCAYANPQNLIDVLPALSYFFERMVMFTAVVVVVWYSLGLIVFVLIRICIARGLRLLRLLMLQ